MELVEGPTIAQVIARLRDPETAAGTPFGSPAEGIVYYGRIATAFAGAAEGLQHAHESGVIHRDVKPSNLIVGRKERLRILDFGLARLEGHEGMTVSGDLIGTPLYMSPEQARRQRIALDHRTDIYWFRRSS